MRQNWHNKVRLPVGLKAETSSPNMEAKESYTAGGETGYEAPKLTIHGSVEEITRASHVGYVADQNIPAGTSVIGRTSL
jgi:hypothetical protein